MMRYLRLCLCSGGGLLAGGLLNILFIPVIEWRSYLRGATTGIGLGAMLVTIGALFILNAMQRAYDQAAEIDRERWKNQIDHIFGGPEKQKGDQ